MAKKKSVTSGRTHQFKYAVPKGAPVNAQASSPSSSVSTKRPTAATTIERDFSYVAHDLRRILFLGGGLLVSEFILNYLYNHTGLGVYLINLVRL